MRRIMGGRLTGEQAGSLHFTTLLFRMARQETTAAPGFHPEPLCWPLARFATRWSRWEIGEIWRASARAVWRSRPSRKCWSLSRNFHQRFIVKGGHPPESASCSPQRFLAAGRLGLISEIVPCPNRESEACEVFSASRRYFSGSHLGIGTVFQSSFR